jgi:hypothetical protein
MKTFPKKFTRRLDGSTKGARKPGLVESFLLQVRTRMFRREVLSLPFEVQKKLWIGLTILIRFKYPMGHLITHLTIRHVSAGSRWIDRGIRHLGTSWIQSHVPNLQPNPRLCHPAILNDEQDHLYVTDHSLGGANAQLFSTHFAFDNPLKNVYLTTFGAPRCGSPGFKIFSERMINLNMFRLVNGNDVV